MAGLLLAALWAATAPADAAELLAASRIADLSLEELAAVRVTSVTGRPQSVGDAAASIFVISAADIRRSAATSLPEALRLAPNLEVARLNAGQYAISARGFNNAVGNKLLVLVDGRIVYSPLFAGVFWDAQDVVLADIERIEVISGPGATLWGANAVNGVINVITRAAAQTQGTQAGAIAGPDGSRASLRYGGAFGDHGQYRVYALRTNRDNTSRSDGVERPDASSKEQLGFRVDWGPEREQLTLQGDAYTAGRDASSNLAPLLYGANLVARWKHALADGSNWQLQAVWDQDRRDDAVLFRERTRTFDLQFNHVPVTGADHQVIWGAGYRQSRSEGDRTTLVRFDPEVRHLSWANVFAQDEIRLADPLRVTVGAKIETNTYTGVEFLPTLRASYRLQDRGLLWGSLSRAVRAPARVDRDFYLPSGANPFIRGGPNFESEVANVAEVGYRSRPTSSLSWSVTAFHHQYGRLRGGTNAPTFIENRVSGSLAGVEAWATWDVSPDWRLTAGAVELRKSLHSAPGSSATTVADLGNDPKHQWSLRSTLDLAANVEFDVAVRHVSALPAPVVEAYTATDLRLAWMPRRDITLGLVVQNAFDPGHVEFNAVSAASVIPRSVFVTFEWRPR